MTAKQKEARERLRLERRAMAERSRRAKQLAAAISRVPYIARAPRLVCDIPDALHLELWQLRSDDCRYPYGDGPFTFCGHPSFNGSSYCEAHFRLTHSNEPPRHRNLTAADRARRRELGTMLFRTNFGKNVRAA